MQDHTTSTKTVDVARERGLNRSIKRFRRKSRSANNQQIYFGGEN